MLRGVGRRVVRGGGVRMRRLYPQKCEGLPEHPLRVIALLRIILKPEARRHACIGRKCGAGACARIMCHLHDCARATHMPMQRLRMPSE